MIWQYLLYCDRRILGIAALVWRQTDSVFHVIRGTKEVDHILVNRT